MDWEGGGVKWRGGGEKKKTENIQQVPMIWRKYPLSLYSTRVDPVDPQKKILTRGGEKWKN